MRLRISRCVIDTIQRHAQAAAPLEACGLLFGENGPDFARVTACQAVRNVAETPDRRFEIDPAALFAALRAERGGGPRILGYWHSHPAGAAIPSPTDAAMAAADGRIWLIAAGGGLSAWRAGDAGLHGRFAAVEIEAGGRGSDAECF